MSMNRSDSQNKNGNVSVACTRLLCRTPIPRDSCNSSLKRLMPRRGGEHASGLEKRFQAHRRREPVTKQNIRMVGSVIEI